MTVTDSVFSRRRDDGYVISTDLGAIDRELVHRWLSTDAYWAMGRTRETVDRAMEHSLNFGLRAPDGRQVGYARVVTDGATFAWLCDVYVDRDERGAGLGVWLVRTVCDHLAPLGLRRILLATQDAQGLYEQLGFEPLADPDRWMVRGAQQLD
ncbi:MAG: GNAT family N-acetyltransferase [Acidimicrobiales bacterium]